MLAAVLTAIVVVGVALCDSPDTSCCKGCRRIEQHAQARRFELDAAYAAEGRYVVEDGPYR